MLYEILQNFKGSQDGLTTTEFVAGTQVEISDYLAPHVTQWARPVRAPKTVKNKAHITDGGPTPAGSAPLFVKAED